MSRKLTLRPVFVCSSAKTCLEKLEAYANERPTVVILEFTDNEQPTEASSDVKAKEQSTSLRFLQALATETQGARYQQHVIPFVMLVDTSKSGKEFDSNSVARYFTAGATDIVHSPFQHEDMSRLVGHVVERTRPPAQLIGSVMAQDLVDSIRNTETPPESCHRPDMVVSQNRQDIVEEATKSWTFPAQDFNMDELTCAAMFMLEAILSMNENKQYSLPRAQLMAFLLATRRQYKHEREVHYHNWRHAVDVTQSLYCFLMEVHLAPSDREMKHSESERAVERLLSPEDGLVLLVSAIGHDVGHPGVNNAFLVACSHPLAQMYNDKSVLENYHGAAYSQLLRRHWPSLKNFDRFRSTLISNILATDMQRHFDFMGSLEELKDKIEQSEQSVDDWSEKDRSSTRELVLALLMKAADISNVARPFDVSSGWAKILMNEFARQGELENELQIPTCLFGGPPNKEDHLAAAQSQNGFISLFGYPLFMGIAEIMPSVSCSAKDLQKNKEIWEQKIEAEKQRRESNGSSAPLTFSSVTQDEVDEAKRKQSQPPEVPAHLSQPPSSPTYSRTIQAAEGVTTDEHPAQEQMQHSTWGFSTPEKRASAPLAVPLSPHGGTSRRSSKDVALDQFHDLHRPLSPSVGSGSRRGSVDAGIQMNQSFPSSRRGSKDESLTTILVTNRGSPVQRQSPSTSPNAGSDKHASPGKASGGPKRYSTSQAHQKQAAARSSVPSSRSHATSSATAATTQPSPSTQPSSIAATEDELTPPAANMEDPFTVPGTWPGNVDGNSRVPAPEVQPVAQTDTAKDEARVDEAEDSASSRPVSRLIPSKSGERGIRESRSRSRLRGLKFWKKKRDVSGVESVEAGSSP